MIIISGRKFVLNKLLIIMLFRRLNKVLLLKIGSFIPLEAH